MYKVSLQSKNAKKQESGQDNATNNFKMTGQLFTPLYRDVITSLENGSR